MDKKQLLETNLKSFTNRSSQDVASIHILYNEDGYKPFMVSIC